MNSIVSVPTYFFNPGTGGQVCCTLSWSIPLHPYWLGVCIPIYFYSFAFGCIFEYFTWLTLLVFDLVLYLCVLVISTLMSFLCVFYTYGITWWYASGLSAFIFPVFIFGLFHFYWCNCNFFAWLKMCRFFCWVYWLGFLWAFLYYRHPQRLCIGEWH